MGESGKATFFNISLTSYHRTTTELTTTFSTWVANLIGLNSIEKGVEVVVRAVRPLPFSPNNPVLIRPALLRLEHNLQHYHVDTLHQGALPRFLHDPSRHHEHFFQLHDYRYSGVYYIQ